jgi:hypothetical protein
VKLDTGAMALAAGLLAAAACGGGGRPITVRRSVEPFHSIEIAGPAGLSIESGDVDVRLTGGRAAARGAAVEVLDGVLVIRPAAGEDGGGAVEARIRTPHLRRLAVTGDADVELDLGDAPRERLELAVDGAGRVSVRGVDAELLRVDVAGAAEVRILGRVERLEVAADGAGNLDLRELCAETADAALDGVGSAAIVASVRLDARIDGVGLLRYFAPHELPAPAGGASVKRLPNAGPCGR